MVSPYSLDVPGGVQEQARGLAKELARRGHSLTLVSPGRASAPRELGDDVVDLRVGRVHAVPANGSAATLTFSLGAARATARSLIASGIEVVHLHEPVVPVLGWPFLRSRSAAVVGTFHRSGVDPLYRLAGLALRGRVRGIDATTAVSAAAAATAHEVLGIDSEVLFNGIDVASYEEAEPWPTSGPTVLFLGRDEQRKGRDVLVRAAGLLDDEVTVWATGEAPSRSTPRRGARIEYLGVISDEEKRRRLRGASVLCAPSLGGEAFGIPDRGTVPGFVGVVGNADAADFAVLCAPSLGGESFGIVLLEAMAAGVSVVCSDIDGYRQALDGCGAMVPPGDPESLAAALRLSLASPRSDEVERGRQRASSWSLSVLADRYEAVYDHALSVGRHRYPG